MDARSILSDCKLRVDPGVYSVVLLSENQWRKALENPDLSPRMEAPFVIFRDESETTLVLDEQDLKRLISAMPDARRETGFRLITFDVELDFGLTGFLSEIARILATAGVPILAYSSFSRDHLLVRQSDLARALKALGTVVKEVC